MLNLEINERHDIVVKKRSKKIKEKKSNPYLLPMALVLIVGIGLYAILGGGGDSTHATDIPSGSTPPLTLVPVSLPDYALQTEEISGAYAIATQIPDVLEKMPCYCSCGASAGHKSLKNCYISDDGSFDRHGSFCKLCIDEAYDIYGWYREGVPLEEIRYRIDRAYGTGYGTGTDTPPV